jgi:hypothetical protein
MKNALSYGPGSIGETANSYATGFLRAVVNNYGSQTAVTNVDDFKRLFLVVVEARKWALSLINQNFQNPITTIDEVETVFTFLEAMEEAAKLREETLCGDNTLGKIILDLPTMILYCCLLESSNTRQGLAAANSTLLEEVLRIIYDQVKCVCSSQIFISEEDFVAENKSKLKLILLELDPSLKTLIKFSLLQD